MILGCIKEVEEKLRFKERVLTEYKKIGKDINIFKNEVMRELSKSFKRDEMKKVYTFIKNDLQG